MEHTPEQAAEGMAIVKVLATVLERLVCANVTLARTDPGQVTKFHALKAPGIGILPYLERIHKYASCSNECFILALIYIDRLIQRNNFLLTELNVHRVIITAILLAAKFFDDAYYNNAYYSKVGGVLVSEMNGLEVDFLFRINFSLHVTPELFDKYKAELVAHAINQGLSMPQMPQAQPQPSQLVEPNQMIAMDGHQNGCHMAAPVALQAPQTHHIPPHVTPSPSHVNTTHAAPSVESQQVQAAVAMAAANNQLYIADQMFQNGLAQQLMQRAHSLPAVPSQQRRRCGVDTNNRGYNSAPMVAMLPAGSTIDEQYMAAMVGNHVFPLQQTLVHHNLGALETFPEQAFQQVQGYALAAAQDNHLGSLVAGAHY